MFIDIYDWYDGVNEHGIDLSRSIYKDILQINFITDSEEEV